MPRRSPQSAQYVDWERRIRAWISAAQRRGGMLAFTSTPHVGQKRIVMTDRP